MRLMTMCLMVVALAVGAVRAEVSAQPWVSMGADGLLKYRADDKGNRIPDFSMIGYGTGIIPLPGTKDGIVVPAKITLEPGEGDQTSRIQKAVDDLSKLPIGKDGYRGALLLKKGEYPISGTIKILASGIILRGEGDDLKTGTVLRDTGTDKDPLIDIGPISKPKPIEDTRHKITDDYVPVGAYHFNVDGTSGLKVGDTVIVERGCNDAWIKFIGAHKPGIDWPVTFPIVKADRVITAIKGNTITIDAPIPTALEQKFGGATIVKYEWADRVQYVGVEHVYGISNTKSNTDEDHCWRFIRVDASQHVFVHNITAQHFAYSAVNITGRAKWVTVLDSKCLDPISVLTGARRYSFCLDGQLSLIRGCYARKGRHDFVANDYQVTGPNAFVDCIADQAYTESGPHRHWTSAMLFDNLTTNERLSLYHRRNYGRTKDAKPPYHLGHGWASANCVAWNCNIKGILLVDNPPGANNWAIGCKSGSDKGKGHFESSGKPVEIRSLYDAQLAERMKLAKSSH